MFSDPVSTLMLIILLFFAGLLVMFIFILRSLELGSQNQEETRRQLSISLTDLERKVAELTFALREKGVIDIEYASEHDCKKLAQPASPAQDQAADDLGSLFDKFSRLGDERPDDPSDPHKHDKQDKQDKQD